MALYLDSSALVKLYVKEHGSVEVAEAVGGAPIAATVLAAATETVATVARLARMEALSLDEARSTIEQLWADWPRYLWLAVDKSLVRRAADLAWQHGLRGYDAVHLASALKLQDRAGELITVATFDRHLAHAARQSGLATLPEDLEAFFSAGQRHRRSESKTE